jgi:alcohol dehydrogenase class IV
MSIATDFTFTTPTRIVFEWGAATNGRLASEAGRLGRRPLVVTGRSLAANGTLDALLATLRDAGLEPAVHAGVPPEPDLEAVEACRCAVVSAGADSLIAIGGGSALDVGKAAAALARDGQRPVLDYFEGRAAVPESDAVCPILAAPTTAGTGSEVTWVGVFTDRASGRKASIRGGAMMPAVAVVDAALTLSCPDAVTAQSGMDAFVQAVEAYTSRGATALTDALALEAARQCSFRTLAAITHTPTNRQAREAMALGSLMAGMALNTARLGLVHGLAHPVGAATGAAHGQVCALLLLPVMRFNREVAAAKYARLALELLGEETAALEPQSAAEALMEVIDLHLRAVLQLPMRLRDIGLSAADLPRIADESLPSGSTRANPRSVSATDALAVLESCY